VLKQSSWAERLRSQRLRAQADYRASIRGSITHGRLTPAAACRRSRYRRPARREREHLRERLRLLRDPAPSRPRTARHAVRDAGDESASLRSPFRWHHRPVHGQPRPGAAAASEPRPVTRPHLYGSRSSIPRCAATPSDSRPRRRRRRATWLARSAHSTDRPACSRRICGPATRSRSRTPDGGTFKTCWRPIG